MVIPIFCEMNPIYLDNAATTKPDKRVVETMLPWLDGKYGNASSVHKFGREAKVLLEDARDLLAEFIGAHASEIYFTSGGTEANNFAIKGIAFNRFGTKKHIISTRIEHSAVLDTLEYLKTRFGFEISWLSNDKFGKISPSELESLIRPDTLLTCIMHSNNELGVINDINAVSDILHSNNILLHSDSVQSLGKVKLNVNELNADTLTFSAHKIYGPKGIGALFIRKNTPIDKFIHGGKQERGRRGGTENIAALAGFKCAIDILKLEMESDVIFYKRLSKTLIEGLNKNFGDKIAINRNESGNNLPNIVNISFLPAAKTDAETVLIKYDLAGIAVSSGSACTSGSVQPSHVLKAIGYDDNASKSSVRISFGRYNTESDVERFLEVTKQILS